MRRRFEGENLEEAIWKASQELQISVAQLQYRTIQYPRKGVLGLFKRRAIIEVVIPDPTPETPLPQPREVPQQLKKEPTPTSAPPPPTQEVASPPESSPPSPQPPTPSPSPSQKRGPQGFGVVETPEELLPEIEEAIFKLIGVSCFDVSIKELRFLEDGRLYLRLDGPDNSLLIGREGYRYNSLNLLLYTWLFQKYRIKLKLEVGDFLENQTKMVRRLIEPTIEQVRQEGYGKTPALRGFLPYIAQELLRQEFPDMYVKVKGREGERFVVIRPFYGHNSSDRNP
jgi:spoIIIJ-associated protein